MKPVLLKSAYVLHRRPYRESSFLVELFTEAYGRLTVIAKGARQSRSVTQGILQPFMPLLVSWSGKSDLKTLTQIELAGEVPHLRGDCLFAGFYLNELMMRLLHKWDPYPRLYQLYKNSLSLLKSGRLEEKVLRHFEKHLLEEIGYGLLQKSSRSLHNTVSPEKYYRFIHEEGFVLSEKEVAKEAVSSVFSGKNLLAIAEEKWEEAGVLQDAKRLMRHVLAPLLGERPIYSRLLFVRNQHDE